MILCGEEDYGCSLEEFIRNKRKGKVRLALLRLLNPLGVEEDAAVLWKGYLLAHTKGCETEETWEVLLEEHGYEENYFRLFAEIGALREDKGYGRGVGGNEGIFYRLSSKEYGKCGLFRWAVSGRNIEKVLKCLKGDRLDI